MSIRKKKSDSPLPTGIMRGIERRELLAKVPLSFPTIWKQMIAGTFPRGRKVGGRTIWLENEIDDWLATLPTRELKGDTEPTATA